QHPAPPLLAYTTLSRSRADVEAGANQRDIKILLAEELVARFHGEEAAANAHRSAGNRLKEGELPEDLPEVVLESDSDLPISAVLDRKSTRLNSSHLKTS